MHHDTQSSTSIKSDGDQGPCRKQELFHWERSYKEGVNKCNLSGKTGIRYRRKSEKAKRSDWKIEKLTHHDMQSFNNIQSDDDQEPCRQQE
ncbi:hypothetical protein Trydic_g20571 [Trypoxylus dichotomus]